MAQCQVRNPVATNNQCLKTKCKNVLRGHNQPVDHLCDNDLISTLKKGVLVNGNTLFWADETLRLSCEKFARALSITWGSNCEYWAYKKEKHRSGNNIEVAELLNVCWLEVQGTFNANILAPCTEYEVVFDIKMTNCASGWDFPVKFTLNTPDGCKIESQKCMKQYIGKCNYQEINIGKFRTGSFPNPCESTVGFKLQELNGQWKRGLIVRGVIVRPVKGLC
uniref:Lectin n=1 Tax=Limonium bicolor TaxID=293754 RepID=A8D8Y3_9CARY|nr:lectin [Limonium bicolor]